MKIRRLLMLLWLVPTTAMAQQSYYGTTASSIRLSDTANPSDIQKVAIRPGEVITPENIRRSIQALFDTGRYRTVEADAVTTDRGTQLTFNVTRHYFFSTIALKPDNLLERSLSALIRLPVGQKFSEKQLQEVLDETKLLLKDAGYFEISLTAILGPDGPDLLRSVTLQAENLKTRAKISSIEIEGDSTTIPAPEIRNLLHISSGDGFSSDQIEKGLAAVKKAFLERNYVNTRIDASPAYDSSSNTVRLTLTIDPGQLTIVDTGNQIEDKEIRKLLPVLEEGSSDPDLVREGRVRTIEYLQREGYFDAKVEGPTIERPDSTGPIRITFSIDKGERHKVRSVVFQGNTFFSDKELLERIKVRAASLHGFFSHGLFTDQLLEIDRKAIQNMYHRAGFEAAFVEARHPDSPQHGIDVIFDIIENQRYSIEKLTLTGNQEITESALRRILIVREGEIYSVTAAEDSATAMLAYYYDQGFSDAHIEAAVDRNPETGGRLLTYQISEGKRYRMGKILVSGNTRTVETIITRKSELGDSPWFSPERARQAQQKLYASGLFSHVDVVPLDLDSGDLQTVLIQVEEGKTLILTPGLGVKEYAGPRATLDIANNNLFGRDRSLTLRFRWGVHEQQFQATYREPRLFNHGDLDGYGTLTAERTNRRFFEASRLELAIQARKTWQQKSPPTPASKSLSLTASYQTVNLEDVKLNPIVRKFPDLKGIIHISRLGASYVAEGRDSPLNPRQGSYYANTFQVADRAWGSEVDFISLFHQTSIYRKARKGTIALSERVGWKLPYGLDNELPITERYFAGGSTTLRGFGLDEAGPPGGGQFLTIANLEYRVPLRSFSLGDLGGALFYDTGNVFEHPAGFSLKEFTHSAGLGLRFYTPLGPIRFDVGFNLLPKTRLLSDGSQTREGRTKLFFTLGHAF